MVARQWKEDVDADQKVAWKTRAASIGEVLPTTANEKDPVKNDTAVAAFDEEDATAAGVVVLAAADAMVGTGKVRETTTMEENVAVAAAAAALAASRPALLQPPETASRAP